MLYVSLLCYVMLCYMLRYVVLHDMFYVMLCYVSCYMLCYFICYVICYVYSMNTVQQSDNKASIRDRSEVYLFVCLLSRVGQSQCRTYNVVTLCCVIWYVICYFIFYVMLFDMLCYMLFYMLCYMIFICYVICYFICYMLFYMLCYVICYFICHMLCYVMLCYVMLCFLCEHSSAKWQRGFDSWQERCLFVVASGTVTVSYVQRRGLHPGVIETEAWRLSLPSTGESTYLHSFWIIFWLTSADNSRYFPKLSTLQWCRRRFVLRQQARDVYSLYFPPITLKIAKVFVSSWEKQERRTEVLIVKHYVNSGLDSWQKCVAISGSFYATILSNVSWIELAQDQVQGRDFTVGVLVSIWECWMKIYRSQFLW